MRLAWKEGEPEVLRAVEAWWNGESDAEATVLADSARRQIVRLQCDGRPPIRVKQFRKVLHRGGRERLKAALGFAPAQREWRALLRLHAAGLPVPKPLGRSAPVAHPALLVTEFAEGRPLTLGLRAEAAERRRWLSALGQRIAELHRAGFRHGDLHAGNLIVTADGPVLLDLQRVRRAFTARAKRRDLGRLDFSLAQCGFSRADRLRVRSAALGLRELRSPASRRALRAVARVAERRARAHHASRTRRCRRPGRRFARVAPATGRGMRLASFSDRAVREALAAHRAALAGSGSRILKCDHRARVSSVAACGHRVVVKEVTKRGWARQLADRLRGSPARRAWIGGHGLLARGIASATPLAYVETLRFGFASASALILEDLRPARPASELRPGEVAPSELVGALCRLAVSLHQRRVVHGDFQCLHIFLVPGDSGLRPTLIDLEGVRFRRRVSDAHRIRALAALNASLPEALAPAALRRRAFERYARALAFRGGPEAALRRLIERSLKRGHAWTGADCGLSGPP